MQFSAYLGQVDNGHLDVRALERDDRHGGATDVAGSNAANRLDWSLQEQISQSAKAKKTKARTPQSPLEKSTE
jgi:hypothetical protein